MIYLSGKVRADLPAMLTPRMRQGPPDGQLWAADNGRFASPHEYSDESYLAWLERMPAERCLFATAPDVVGDAVATLLLSAPMYGPIREAGYQPALVAQDGLERLPEMIPWHAIGTLFIGGTDRWRHSEAVAELAREAKRRGRWLHMGRVNSLRRLQWAHSLGCDSADGTVLKHDPARPVEQWAGRVLAQGALWRPEP